MRVMVLVKATKDSEAGVMPSAELLEAMGRFNEELADAGILQAGDGLQPSAKGKRVAFDGPSDRSPAGRSTRPASWSPASGSGGSATWTRRWRG